MNRQRAWWSFAHWWVSERLASAVTVEREHVSFSRQVSERKRERERERSKGGEEKSVRAAAHVISNETSTCLIVEIIATFSSLKANLHALRSHRRYGITRRESESSPFSHDISGDKCVK